MLHGDAHTSLNTVTLKNHLTATILQSWHFRTVSSAWPECTPSGPEFLAGWLLILFSTPWKCSGPLHPVTPRTDQKTKPSQGILEPFSVWSSRTFSAVLLHHFFTSSSSPEIMSYWFMYEWGLIFTRINVYLHSMHIFTCDQFEIRI